MKSTNKKKSGGSSGGGAQQFLVWHGEKIIVGIVVVLALWFAMQGLGYQTLKWQPSDLERDADTTQNAIRGSTRTAEDEGIVSFDHAAFAEQIRNPIRTEPYRHQVLWDPAPSTSSQAGAWSQSRDY